MTGLSFLFNNMRWEMEKWLFIWW